MGTGTGMSVCKKDYQQSEVCKRGRKWRSAMAMVRAPRAHVGRRWDNGIVMCGSEPESRLPSSVLCARGRTLALNCRIQDGGGMLFRLSFLFVFSFFSFLRNVGPGIPRREPGRCGESVPSKSSRSDRSESEASSSENGKRPSANSINDMPRDHTSDLRVS